MSAWFRAGRYTVHPDHVVAIEQVTRSAADPGGATVARLEVRLVLSLPSPHDGLPWVITARGADAWRLARRADRLAAGPPADPGDDDEQRLRDAGLGDMAASVE